LNLCTRAEFVNLCTRTEFVHLAVVSFSLTGV